MSDRPRFRPERGASRRAPWSLVVLLMVVTAALAARALWPQSEREPILIEVVGEVPRPGTYAVESGTLHAALVAAGADPSTTPDGPVPSGFRVVVDASGAHVERPSNPVLVGLPVDPNTAARHELIAIPGIGPVTADRLLGDRAAHGPYRRVDDLRRVLRADTLDQIEPFIALSEVPPIDLNHASAGELETLAGVGPVIAARIVVDREDNGPYTTIDELVRVKGIGPAMVQSIAPLVQLTP